MILVKYDIQLTIASGKLLIMKLILCEVPGSKDGSIETYSPFCLKARRALTAASLPFEVKQSANPGSFKSHNPKGQVPILLVDDKPICDSTEILEFVTQQSGLLLPKHAEGRAEAWHWEEFADRVLNGYLVAARWIDDDNWPRTRMAYFEGAPWFVHALIAPKLRKNVHKALDARDFTRGGLAALWAEFERALDRLEVRAPMDGFWIAGSDISVADVSLFGQLQALRTDLTPKQRTLVTQRRALARYLDRVDERTRVLQTHAHAHAHAA
jgi:glutathione S-transferase